MSDTKKYYVVYWTPLQMGSMIHVGSHPLLPNVQKALIKSIVDKINLANTLNGIVLPYEACVVTWVTEMPKEPILADIEVPQDLPHLYAHEYATA